MGKKGGSVDVKDKGGFSRHAFFDYPIEVRLAETDFFSPDGAKPLTIDAETMKKIHTVLETGSVKSISLTHVFTISENLVSFVTGNIYGGKEGACIDTLDFASGRAETAVTALRTGQGVAQALSDAGVSQADGTANGLNKVLDVFKVCSDDLKGIAKTLGGKVGGDAAYLVTMKAERADSNKCRRSQSCSTLTLLLMSFGIVLHVTRARMAVTLNAYFRRSIWAIIPLQSRKVTMLRLFLIFLFGETKPMFAEDQRRLKTFL